MTITAANEDYDISHYTLYWGANNAAKLPQGVKRYTFSDDLLTLDHGGIEELLITSDDGQTIYLQNRDYTVDVTRGEVTAINAAIENTTVRIRYALPPIAEMAKGDPLIHSFAANTAIPSGATHLMVFSKNEYGEMVEGISTDIE